MKMLLGFALGFLFCLYVSAALTMTLYLGVVTMPRATAAVITERVYEFVDGRVPTVAQTQFTDLDDVTPVERVCIQQLYGLEITRGTSMTTFSPHDKLTIAQALLFAGRTMMLLAQ